MRHFTEEKPRPKVLIYSFDVMLGTHPGEKWFATMCYKFRKDIFGTYTIDKDELERYVYSKYPKLRDVKWHMEENPQDTFESDKAQPTVIKEKLIFSF